MKLETKKAGSGRPTQNKEDAVFNNNFKENSQEKIRSLKERLPSIISCTELKEESRDSFCGPCPKCGGKDRFVYKTDSGKGWCRQCHEKPMDVIDFHSWINGKSLKALLAENFLNDVIQEKIPLNPSAGMWTIFLKEHTNEKPVNNFFSNRGNSHATAKTAYDEGKVRFAKHDTMDCVAFPYKTFTGEVGAIQFLTVNGKPFPHFDGKNKVFTKGSKPGEACFSQHGTPIDDADTIVVVESVTDAISGAEAFPEVCWLAIGSTSYTKKVKAVRSYRNQGKKIVCAFDNDDAGSAATQKVAKYLGIKTHSVKWSEFSSAGDDINDLLKAGKYQTIVDMVRDAEPVRNFLETISEGVEAEEALKKGVPVSDLPLMIKGKLQLRDLTKQSWDAILDKNTPPVFFEGPNGVVSIHKKNKNSPEHCIRPVNVNVIRHRLTIVSNWCDKKRKGEIEVLEAIPPLKYVCENMLADTQPPLPYLKRISKFPFYTESGYLHCTPGYSEKSQCYLELDKLTIPMISDDPTHEEIKRARVVIYSLVNDFPFTSVAERAHAISLMILPFVREMISGPTPLHLIESPTPGTGKTLLAETLTVVALGRVFPAMTEGRNDEEWRKRITSKLINDPPFIFIDNVRHKIDSSALASVMTCSTWEDRILGKTEMINLPVNCGWVATGNNPTLSSEMTRRTVRIRIDAEMDRPGQRTKDQFKHPELLLWVKENRARIISSILTLVQAWIKAGKPTSETRIGSFEEWSDVMGGILKVGGINGFLENLNAFYEDSDAEARTIKDFLLGWYQEYKSITVGVAELYNLVMENDIPIDIGDKSERSQKTKLGQNLRRLKGRHFEIEIKPGIKTTVQVKAGKKVHRIQQWQLVEVKCVPQNEGTPIGTHIEDTEIITECVPGVPGVPKTGSYTCIEEVNKPTHAAPVTHTDGAMDRGKGTQGTPGTHNIYKTNSYKGVPVCVPQNEGTHDGEIIPSCEVCKCSDKGTMECYHSIFAVGKKKNILPCDVAIKNCPGFIMLEENR